MVKKNSKIEFGELDKTKQIPVEYNLTEGLKEAHNDILKGELAFADTIIKGLLKIKK